MKQALKNFKNCSTDPEFGQKEAELEKTSLEK